MSSSKILKRLVLVVAWIAFYFVLIDVAYSVKSYGSVFIFWIPSLYYIFTGLAIVLGPATDYVLRICFRWYTTRFYDFFFILIFVPVVFGSLMYGYWIGMIP